MNLTVSAVLFLQESGQGGGSPFGLMWPMIAIFAIMYFLIFRPQAKKRKQHEAMLKQIKKGDKVVTAGGIHGTVAGVKEGDKTLVLRIADNVKIEVSRGSISSKAE